MCVRLALCIVQARKWTCPNDNVRNELIVEGLGNRLGGGEQALTSSGFSTLGRVG